MCTVELLPTRCAICNTKGNAIELYSSNFDLQSFNPAVFSARRMPDRIHYHMVKCITCGLVRSDPIADRKVLSQLYAKSTFDYANEVENLRVTYGRYLKKLDRYGVKKNILLEIGCGNGFFLEEALRQGYLALRGVEPSSAAIAKASPNIKRHIICDVMRPGLFRAEQFDLICMFQVLDHIPDPVSLLKECLNILKPGGLILCVNHNIEAFSSQILRERSPVIDIGHTYLFSPNTMKGLFNNCNFQVKKTGSLFNRYTLDYLLRLLPLPKMVKRIFLSFLKTFRIGKLSVTAPLGNLYLVAQKGK